MSKAEIQLGRVVTGSRDFVTAVVRRFIADHCLLHASALTYTTLLSIVPLLALMFSLLKGLEVQRQLEPLLLSRLALEPETTDRLMEYIANTNVKTLGALGGLTLLASVITLMGAIEGSFNHIWRVPSGRPWWRKATDYVSAVLLTPFLLLAAVGITSSLHEQALLRWALQTEVVGTLVVRLLGLAPYAINVLALGVLYTILPNRRPNFRSIFFGALLAGCAWQVVQSSYVALQIGVARYNAIYGALAQLPVTLVWIYVSWLVVLAGAEIAAVAEAGPEADLRGDQTASQMGAALHVLLRAGESFRDGGGGVDPLRIARELRVDAGFAIDVIERLRRSGLLAIESGSGRYLLARDPAAIDLGMISGAFDRVAAPLGCDARVESMLDQVDVRRHAELRRYTLADLLEESPTSEESLRH